MMVEQPMKKIPDSYGRAFFARVGKWVVFIVS